MIKGMTIHATNRRVKRSFTLTPDVAAFVSETRQKQRARSDSEALDLLLRESMLEAKRRQLDAAFTGGPLIDLQAARVHLAVAELQDPLIRVEARLVAAEERQRAVGQVGTDLVLKVRHVFLQHHVL